MHSLPDADTDIVEPVADVSSRRDGTGRSAILVAVGGAIVVVAGFGLVAEHPLARLVLAAFGLAAAYRGLDTVAKARFGPRFELGFWIAAAWLIAIVLGAAFADLLPLSEARRPADALDAPILARPDLFSSHPLGTDRHGLDILGGVLYGARVSLIVGVGATLIGAVVGSALGLISGFYRKKIAVGIGLVTDALLAFPTLILLMAMVAVLRPSVTNVTIALGVVIVPIYVRLARANTLRFADREFVLAARTMGDTRHKVLVREILPNVSPPVASYSFLVLASIIVAEASLSFLGLSVRRPNPTWGNMIAAGQSDIGRDPHLVFAPGLALFLTVYALNHVGERARRAWDPRDAKV